MIFTCCVLAIVLICFLICILRNSEILVANTSESQDNLNLNDIYLAGDDNSSTQNMNLLINLPFEKPPSYIDVLKEIGQPPPVYQRSIYGNDLDGNQQTQIVTLSSTVQNALVPTNSARPQDELILDCNQWLEQSNNERVSLESRLLETRLAQEYRENLRRLSRDSERCHLPNILSRSHSSPVIRNSLLLRTQQLFNLLSQNAANDLLIHTLTSNPSSSTNLLNNLNNDSNHNQSTSQSTTSQSSTSQPTTSQAISNFVNLNATSLPDDTNELHTSQ